MIRGCFNVRNLTTSRNQTERIFLNKFNFEIFMLIFMDLFLYTTSNVVRLLYNAILFGSVRSVHLSYRAVCLHQKLVGPLYYQTRDNITIFSLVFCSLSTVYRPMRLHWRWRCLPCLPAPAEERVRSGPSYSEETLTYRSRWLSRRRLQLYVSCELITLDVHVLIKAGDDVAWFFLHLWLLIQKLEYWSS